MKYLITILGFSSYITIFTYLNYLVLGHVGSVLWDWYLVPVFELPKVSFWMMTGIIVTMRFILPPFDNLAEETKDMKNLETRVAYLIFKYLALPYVTLFIAWLIKFFV